MIPSANFDLLAPHYAWLECLLAGRTLQKCRTAFLNHASAARSVLILGEGNGRFLDELLRVNSQASVVCVDGSDAMIERARQRVANSGVCSGRAQFIHADVLGDWLWAAGLPPVDLVVTHFFLDCFRADQLPPLVERIAGHASSQATWLLADFRIPERAIRRTRARLILWLAYAFFRIATRLPARTLTAPDPFLCAAGFLLAERRTYEAGLLHSDVWAKQIA